MARKKKSRLYTIIGTIITLVSGGGIGGYFNPDWPVVGPFIQSLHTRTVSESGDGEGSAGKLRQALNELGVGAEGSVLGGGAPAFDGTVPTRLASSQRPADKLLVATFNIQVFGKSKLSKPDVVDVLAQVVRQFDVVAIQEVPRKDDDILPKFVEAINADGSRYDFLIGPRLGRSVSTEQYAFVYDTTRVEYDPSSIGTMSDPTDLLHREPFVARFRARTNPPDRGFTFWLVNIHTDPDEVKQEVGVLADVFQVMRSARADEDDVLLLGDLNASESQLGRLGQVPGIAWVVGGAVMTNTRQNKAYDNILFDRQATSEFAGRWGVFDLEQAFGLSREQALKVSDHLPVWAEFSAFESAPRSAVADRIPGVRR